MRGFDPEEIQKLEKSKDPLVRKLVSYYKDITTNSAFEALITHKLQIKKWQQQIQNSPANLFALEDGKANKDYEYAIKFLELQEELTEIEEKLIKRLTPEDIKLAEAKVTELSDSDYAGAVEIVGALIKQENKRGKE
jgi:hypothetical protein